MWEIVTVVAKCCKEIDRCHMGIFLSKVSNAVVHGVTLVQS